MVRYLSHFDIVSGEVMLDKQFTLPARHHFTLDLFDAHCTRHERIAFKSVLICTICIDTIRRKRVHMCEGGTESACTVPHYSLVPHMQPSSYGPYAAIRSKGLASVDVTVHSEGLIELANAQLCNRLDSCCFDNRTRRRRRQLWREPRVEGP